MLLLHQQRLTTFLYGHLQRRLLSEEGIQSDYDFWESKVVEWDCAEVALVEGDPLAIKLGHEHIGVQLEVNLLVHVGLQTIRDGLFSSTCTLRLHFVIVGGTRGHCVSTELASPDLMVKNFFHHELDLVADRLLIDCVAKFLCLLNFLLNLSALQFDGVSFAQTLSFFLEVVSDFAQVRNDELDDDVALVALLNHLENVLVANLVVLIHIDNVLHKHLLAFLLVCRDKRLDRLAILSERDRHLEVTKETLHDWPESICQLLEVGLEDLIELIVVYLLLLVLDRFKEVFQLSRVLLRLQLNLQLLGLPFRHHIAVPSFSPLLILIDGNFLFGSEV